MRAAVNPTPGDAGGAPFLPPGGLSTWRIAHCVLSQGVQDVAHLAHATRVPTRCTGTTPSYLKRGLFFHTARALEDRKIVALLEKKHTSTHSPVRAVWGGGGRHRPRRVLAEGQRVATSCLPQRELLRLRTAGAEEVEAGLIGGQVSPSTPYLSPRSVRSLFRPKFVHKFCHQI